MTSAGVQRLHLLHQDLDAAALPTTWGVAIFLDTTIAELVEYAAATDGEVFHWDDLPAELRQRGRNRVSEAKAVLGTANALSVMTHLAIHDFGAGILGFEMVVTEEFHQLWAFVTEEVRDELAG